MGRARGHVIEAGSFEAEAVGYAELHTPQSDGDVRTFVGRLDGGREHCFRIDFRDGAARPCD